MDVLMEELVPVERVAHIIGHEVRNPLAVINNSAYFVKTKLGKSADAKVAKHLAIIEAEIVKADALIGQLVSYARLRVAPSGASINALVEKLLERRRWPPGVGVSTRLDAADPRALIDAQAVGAAFSALLDNAAQETAAGGIVRVSTLADGGSWAVLEVADAGQGFPKESLAEPGAPFLSTRPRGMGLGLALARKVAELHGGRLEVDSEAGRGAAVRLRLPLAKV